MIDRAAFFMPQNYFHKTKFVFGNVICYALYLSRNENVTHNNKGVTPTTGKDTRRYALVLLGRGLSYSEIAAETGIAVETLRVMKTA